MPTTPRAVVVTGGGSGIGRATSVAFARDGAAVAVWDSNEEAAAETLSFVEQNGGTGCVISVDVSDQSSVVEAASKTREMLDGIDGLVTAAAIGGYGELTETSLEEWRRVLATNLDGTFLCVREIARVMRDCGGGSIVLVASDRGLTPEPGWVPYGASKAAVIYLGRAAAVELARHRIRVNVVVPGPTDTPLLRTVDRIPGLLDHIASRTLVGRLAQPGEIAEAIRYCASNPFMTGGVLCVDGGAWLTGQFGIREIVEVSTPPK